MFIFLSRLGRLAVGIAAVVAVTSVIGFNTLATVPVASKHQARSGGSGTVNFVMVADSNANGLPNFGDALTFNVSTTATQYPSVQLDCYQNGSLVYTHSAGFYPTCPWPQSQNFVLKSYVWTGGAADCTAPSWTTDHSQMESTAAGLLAPRRV